MVKPEAHKALQEKKFQLGIEILEISQKPAFQEYLRLITEKVEGMKTQALDAKSYEEFLEYRGEIRGLLYAYTALDAMVNKAKAARRTLEK